MDSKQTIRNIDGNVYKTIEVENQEIDAEKIYFYSTNVRFRINYY